MNRNCAWLIAVRADTADVSAVRMLRLTVADHADRRQDGHDRENDQELDAE